MALIDRSGRPIEDRWADLPVVALDALAAGSGPLGVHLAAGITAEQIAPFLDRLALVAVEFPKFRDGRGFTIARALRERHFYRGEIRAVGHVLPDQFAALIQCGFSSILTPAFHPPEQWRQGAAPAGAPLLRRLIDRR